MNISLPKLPSLYLITPELGDENEEQFMCQLEKSLINGIRLVQFRAKTLGLPAYKELAIKVMACCNQYGTILLLNSDPELVLEVDAHGVHLDGNRLASFNRRPLESNKLISVACHSIAQLKKAEIIGANMVTLSPVLHTASHPEAEPIGWENFASMAKNSTLPVYALGGMDEQLLTMAKENGAYGVAGIRSFWNV